ALECYEHARRANPDDARLLYELDQLHKRTGAAPRERLARLEQHRQLVARRDDLTVELITLLNLCGRSTEALDILLSRRFHPWEGGEGLVSGQFAAAHLLLGLDALARGDARQALDHFDAGRQYPHNLGEGKHLLTRETHFDYFRGIALRVAGCPEQAEMAWRAAAAAGDRENVFAYFRGLAMRELGDEEGATEVLRELHDFADKQMNAEVRIDYFATSLPNFLLFEDDLQKRNRIDCLFLRGIARLGLGHTEAGETDLKEVLALDRNHLFARLELDRLRAAIEQPAPGV
ncbi:MAG TPA: hypothetical protein VFA04_22055, partial [Bryobacteraceae bacterium]|nr:hypothetical protein [Bryobacteraceae bacterium]